MDDNNFHKFKKKVLSARGLDFSSYSEEYVKRRVGIRMLALGLPPDAFAQYLEVLDRSAGEYAELFNAFSVNVTEFFRDISMWKVLYEKVLPRLINEKKKSRVPCLRIWSCACSSGEEPYSIAILLNELGVRPGPGFPVSIIATDIDPDALQKAGAGIYGEQALKNLGMMNPAWPGKYFSPAAGSHGHRSGSQPAGYRLSDGVKDMVAFRRHNFLTEEPFGGMDLIFCRNVIIYLTMEAKSGLIKKICDSLTPDGMFVLGMSELTFTVKGICDFHAVEDRERIYRKGKKGEQRQSSPFGRKGGNSAPGRS